MRANGKKMPISHWLLLIFSSILRDAMSFPFLGNSQVNFGRQATRGRRRTRDSGLTTAHRTMTMKVRVGLVGLPNCGKSSLFNALARRSIAHAANFPFCTIDPKIALIPVPDRYLERLGLWAGSLTTRPAMMEFIDVAGLARGAHRGEGLGNRFLATLRECQALCHVIRVFEDPDIVHVDGVIDPVSDAEAIQLELLLSDLEQVLRRLEKLTCTGTERQTLVKIVKSLERGIPPRLMGLSREAVLSVKSLGLLTLKPVIFTFNVDEVDFVFREEVLENTQRLMSAIEHCDPSKDAWTIVSAKMEAEISGLTGDQQLIALSKVGIEVTSDQILCCETLPSLIQQLLNLFIIYTGPGVAPERSRTTKAHLLEIDRQTTAYELAGRLHRDIQKGFIRAEVTPVSHLLGHSCYLEAKERGVVRTEGRDYILEQNDVALIRWRG